MSPFDDLRQPGATGRFSAGAETSQQLAVSTRSEELGQGPPWEPGARPGWHLLHQFVNDFAPGCSPQVTERVRFRRGRWDLEIVVQEFYCPWREIDRSSRLSNRRLVQLVWERDDCKRALTPRLARLRAIAEAVAAPLVVRYIDNIVDENWPPPPKAPRIASVVGVVARPAWKSTWHAAFGVVLTGRGPGFLYPPREDGTATLVVGTGGDTFEIQVTRLLQLELAKHAPALEKLEAEIEREELQRARDRAARRVPDPPRPPELAIVPPVARQATEWTRGRAVWQIVGDLLLLSWWAVPPWIFWGLWARTPSWTAFALGVAFSALFVRGVVVCARRWRDTVRQMRGR